MTKRDDTYVERNDNFAAILRTVGKGDWINRAGADAQKAIAELHTRIDEGASEAVGTITVKLTFRMGKDHQMLTTAAPIAVKLPAREASESVIITDRDGTVTQRIADPRG